jgi:hypothetical protein
MFEADMPRQTGTMDEYLSTVLALLRYLAVYTLLSNQSLNIFD